MSLNIFLPIFKTSPNRIKPVFKVALEDHASGKFPKKHVTWSAFILKIDIWWRYSINIHDSGKFPKNMTHYS